MSIKNFSKDVLLVASDIKDFRELDAYNQNIGRKVISKIIDRFITLGFTNFKLTGDDSLSVEVEDELTGRGFTPRIFNMYPNAAKPFLLNNIIEKNRSKFIDEMEMLTIPSKRKEEKMIQIEMELGKLLSNEINVIEDVPLERKLDTIKRVMALSYFGIKVDEKNLYRFDSELQAFYTSTGYSEQEIEQMIKDDLDYRWQWARERLYEGITYSNQQNISPDEDDEDLLESDGARLLEIMDLLNGEADKKSNLTFEVDDSKLFIKEEKEEVKLPQTPITLTEGLQTLSKEEFLHSEVLIDKLNEVVKKIDEYTNIVYTQIVEESNLIVDMYVSKKGMRSKRLPYEKTVANKILLSVDLKTGDAEVFFKGQPFKINAFFPKGEPITTNVLDWK